MFCIYKISSGFPKCELLLCPVYFHKNAIHGYHWELLMKIFSSEEMFKERKKNLGNKSGKLGEKSN